MATVGPVPPSPTAPRRGEPDAGGWHRVVTELDDCAAERAADQLWQAGCAGIEEQAPSPGRTRLLAGFDDPERARDAARALAATLGVEATVVPVDDDGLDAWRAWARAERAGRFWLTPTWVGPPDLVAGEEVLWLDPGRTFGSGSHATTRLVVRALEDLVTPGMRVLDVGCGSGVLAIAAARLGAASVTAIDIDPDAPGVTEANAARNGVADVVQASSTPLAVVAGDRGRFDVIAANLLAPVVADLATHLVAALAPAGTLVVSGLLADRWEASAATLAPLVADRTTTADGWAAVTLRFPGTDDR